MLAPALATAPTVDQDGTDQARTSLASFVNGPTALGVPGDLALADRDQRLLHDLGLIIVVANR